MLRGGVCDVYDDGAAGALVDTWMREDLYAIDLAVGRDFAVTWRRWGLVCVWLVLPLLIGTMACGLKGVELAVTAEEGLTSSIPGMRGDPHDSAAYIAEEEEGFREDGRSGTRWMEGGEVLGLAAFVSGLTGLLILRSRRSYRIVSQ
jgi:hypothetical protein